MRLIYFLFLIAITACSTGIYQPSAANIIHANYGSKPNQRQIPNLLLRYYQSSDLYDPAGVRVEKCQEPEKAWWPVVSNGAIAPNQFDFGWKTQCSFNAKDDTGSYLGAVWEEYYLKNGRVVKGYIPSAYKPVFR